MLLVQFFQTSQILAKCTYYACNSEVKRAGPGAVVGWVTFTGNSCYYCSKHSTLNFIVMIISRTLSQYRSNSLYESDHIVLFLLDNQRTSRISHEYECS